MEEVVQLRCELQQMAIIKEIMVGALVVLMLEITFLISRYE